MEAYRVTFQLHGADGSELRGGGKHTRTVIRHSPPKSAEGMAFAGVNSALIAAIERELTARVARNPKLAPLVDIVSVESIDPVIVLSGPAEGQGT